MKDEDERKDEPVAIESMQAAEQFEKDMAEILKNNRIAELFLGMAVVIAVLIGAGIIVGLIKGLVWLIQL